MAAKGRAPIAVTVRFNPKLPVKYRSRFRFEVNKGEGFDLLLEGTGTLAENRLIRGNKPLRIARPDGGGKKLTDRQDFGGYRPQ